MKPGIFILAIAGLTMAQALAAEDPVSPIIRSTYNPAATTPGQSHLLNEWLRERNDLFNHFDIGGDFRVRFEHKEHFAIAGVPGAVDFRRDNVPTGNSYWLFRTRPHLGLKPADWLYAFAEGRDSFTENDKRVPQPESDRMDLQRAFVRFGNAERFPLLAKVGRQHLKYGDERLAGAFEWNNLGRVYDAAKVRYEQEGWWLDGFVGRPIMFQDGQFNTPNNYEWFWGGYAGVPKLFKKQVSEFYFLGHNASPQAQTTQAGAIGVRPTARDVYTIGSRIKSLPGQFSGWDYRAEIAGQFGRYKQTNAGPSLDHAAFALSAEGGYTWDCSSLKPRLGLTYNFSSGDHDPNDGSHNTFDNLFPTNHKFYGHMDFQSWRNVHNPRLRFSLKPAKGLVVALDYHLFWLASTEDFFYSVGGAPRTGAAPGSGRGYGLNPGYSNFIGSEIDLVASYSFRSFLKAQAGYGHFFVGDYVKQSLSSPGFGSADADWVFVQALLIF